jgi:hypothetical membrane protein
VSLRGISTALDVRVMGQVGEASEAPSRRVARALAWFALAGQALFIASWIVSGALQPGYSHVRSAISELGAGDVLHPWIVNAGLVLVGLSVAALGAALPAVLPRRRATRVAAGLFLAAGALLLLAGLFHLDCGLSQQRCLDRFRAGDLSWHSYAHVWLSFGFELVFVATTFAIARALWPAPSGLLALGCGVSGVAILVFFSVVDRPEASTSGLSERIGFGTVHFWATVVAIGILHTTRKETEPGALTPMRPRDFLEGVWGGPGTLVPWPYFFWRRFPIRFEATREFTFFSDEAWLMDDIARFPGGRVEHRRRFFHLVEPNRVHVTADDAPDGTDILLEEDGYRLMPYKFVIPVGPTRFACRCRDEHRLTEDGTLVDTMRLSWHGLPVARITIHARPPAAER